MDSLTKKIHFLVIDDEVGVANALHLLLQAIGYSSTRVTDPEEARQLLPRATELGLDIILCDLRMPVHDGFWVLEQRNQITPNTPFVLMSAHAVSEDIEKALAEGANAFLPKPFDPNDITALLKDLGILKSPE